MDYSMLLLVFIRIILYYFCNLYEYLTYLMMCNFNKIAMMKLSGKLNGVGFCSNVKKMQYKSCSVQKTPLLQSLFMVEKVSWVIILL